MELINFRPAACLLLALGLSLFAEGTHAQTDEDPVVATVGDHEIRFSDVTAVHQTLPPQYQQMPLMQLYPQLVEQLVSVQLMSDAARAANVHEEPEVAGRIQMEENKILQEVYLTRALDAELTEEKLRAQYEKNLAENKSEMEVRARHILLNTEEEANAVIKEIADGADFAEVAKERSTGPSAAQGGDLGYFAKDAMVPEFADAAFSMEKGQISAEPVKTQFGWHVIKVEDRRDLPPPSFEESVAEVRQQIAQAKIQEILAKLRSEVKIEMFNPDGTPIEE